MAKAKISFPLSFALWSACGVNVTAAGELHHVAHAPNTSAVDHQAWLDERTEAFENDATWVLTSSFMILTMQSGFGLLESGCVRTTTSVNVMMKNVIDVIMGGLMFWMLGYGISFGKSFKGFMGRSDFFVTMRESLQELLESPTSVDIFSHYVFHFTFASTATTIISGAVAGRMKFKAYMALSFMNSLLYAFPAHWVFSDDGWLFNLDFTDFGGDGPVHLMGGTAAFIASFVLGPREGRFDPARAEEFDMKDPLTCIAGLFMLWWGWLGFNCGSTFGISGIKWLVASRAAVTTINASIGGGLVGIFVGLKFRASKIHVEDVVNSILSALVTITGGCASVSTYFALLLGMLGAVVGLSTNEALRRFQIIDDPVGAVGVHGASSIFGLFSVGLLANSELEGGSVRDGLLLGGGIRLLLIQTLGIVAILAWTSIWSLTILKILDLTIGLRVDHETEEAGLDWSEHAVAHTGTEFSQCERDKMRELEECVSSMKEEVASSKLEILKLRALVRDLQLDRQTDTENQTKVL